MSLELHIERKVGTGYWVAPWASPDWSGAASPAPGLNVYQSAADIIIAWSGDSHTDDEAHVDGSLYSYRCRIYDNVALTYTAYSNTASTTFATVLIAIERKADAGAYAEVTVQPSWATPWDDAGPFSNGVTYTYKARSYDTDEEGYSDYGNEDAVLYATPSGTAAYYYAMLRE